MARRLKKHTTATAISLLLSLYAIGQYATAFLTTTLLQHQSRQQPTTSFFLATTSSSCQENVQTTTTEEEEEEAIFSFTSPKYCVYIEDTDAYGVMYNSNYIRQYERALTHAPSCNDNDASSSSSTTKRPKQQQQWIMTAITNQKFRSSPMLGSEYVVTGQLVEEKKMGDGSSIIEEEVWQMQMISVPANTNDNNDDVIVYNTATVTIASTPQVLTTTTTSSSPKEEDTTTIISPPSSELKIQHIEQMSFPCYPDEFDTQLLFDTTQKQTQTHHHVVQYIPIRSATNFFERHRTTYLGGHEKLRKLQQEDGILFVVTAMNDAEIYLWNHDDNAISGGGDSGGGIVKNVIVETKFVARKRGMIVDCYHRLLMEMDNSDDNDNVKDKSDTKKEMKIVVAKAKMTVMTLDKNTNRPTSKLPRWLMDLIS